MRPLTRIARVRAQSDLSPHAGRGEAVATNSSKLMSAAYFDATPASDSTVCSSTLAPAVQSDLVASSSSLWLTPSLHGTKIIAAGILVLRLQESWPAPEVMRRLL